MEALRLVVGVDATSSGSILNRVSAVGHTAIILKTTFVVLLVTFIIAALSEDAAHAEPSPPPSDDPITNPSPTAPDATPPPQQPDSAIPTADTAEKLPSRDADSSSNIDVHVSSEVSGYADSNHVFVVSPTIAGTLSNPVAGWSATGRYLVDVVSAASVDIVATASRRWTEQRHVGTLEGSYKPRTFGVSGTADLSVEPDYTSLTVGGAVTQDIFDKNATLLFGYDHRHDISGRSNTPFSVFSHVIDHDGLKAGTSLILDRSTVLTLVGDVMFERGDSSKPYRYIPLFAPGTNVPKGASIDVVNALRVDARPLEQVPLSRNRYVLSARLARRFDAVTIRGDERGYVDTWGLKATTTDARILFDVSSRFDAGPHVRFHAQSPVDFWQRAYQLRPGFDLPALRTGDRELGPLMNFTGGATARIHLGPATHPKSLTLGLDFSLTSTRYLDDLYLSSRLSSVGAISIEADL